MKLQAKITPKRPLIVIDARMIGPTGHGIAEYVRDLVLGLTEISERKYDLHLLVGRGLPDKDVLRKVPHTLVLAPFLSISEIFEVPRVLKKLNADLFHSPSFSAYPFLKIPTLYTVHDLIHLQYGTFLQKIYYNWLLKPALRRAVQVCTVSEFSRGELAKWLDWPKDRIEVVKNAIHLEEPPKDWEERLKKLGLQKHKYHFSLSSSKPHKNMPFLIEAYLAHADKNEAAWPLVVSLTPEEAGKTHSKLICVGGLGREEKNTLLAGAGAFYFPSLLEGFGRPPLEAAAFGVPLVVSDIPVHREVLGGLAMPPLFLSPKKIAEWVREFLSAERKALKNSIIQVSLKKSVHLMRSHLAGKTEKLYFEVLTTKD